MLEPCHLESALEVCACPGHLTDLLRERGVRTVSLDGRYAAEVRGDMHHLPFKDSTFDLVAWRHGLEHSPLPYLALWEGMRVSREWLLVVVPWQTPKSINWPGHFSVLTKVEWERMFALLGLETVICEEGDMSETAESRVDMEWRYLLRRRR